MMQNMKRLLLLALKIDEQMMTGVVWPVDKLTAQSDQLWWYQRVWL